MKVSGIVPARRLNSYDVINREGRDLGQVEEVMLDVARGRVAFVVVSFGGILGLTDKWFALPWELLSWSPEHMKFIMDMPREVLEQAPGLDKTQWPTNIDLSWLAQCYTYYGCAPYWEAPFVTEDNTKRLAYSIWESEGRPEGKAVDHYFRAERILREEEQARTSPAELISVPLQRPRSRRTRNA